MLHLVLSAGITTPTANRRYHNEPITNAS